MGIEAEIANRIQSFDGYQLITKISENIPDSLITNYFNLLPSDPKLSQMQKFKLEDIQVDDSGAFTMKVRSNEQSFHAKGKYLNSDPLMGKEVLKIEITLNEFQETQTCSGSGFESLNTVIDFNDKEALQANAIAYYTRDSCNSDGDSAIIPLQTR
jgi:hypothetical protein